MFSDTILDIKSAMDGFDMLLPQPDWLARMTNDELLEGIDKVLSEEMPWRRRRKVAKETEMILFMLLKSREIQSFFTEIVCLQLAFDFEESTESIDLPDINSD
jgi:hypothetical protein